MFRNSAVVYSSSLLLTIAFAITAQAQIQNSIAVAQPRHPVSVLDSTKEQDGLVGAVRRIKTESSKIGNDSAEGPRELVELTTYGVKGNRIENVSYPVSDPIVGKQEYKYDDHGNITEMTVRDDHGSIVSRESYDYEFDGIGNWVKMVTSLVVFENGQLKREPVENTYRTISYYFTDEVAKIVDSPVKNVPLPVPASNPAENLEQPNINFSAREADSPSTTALGEAPAPRTRPSPVITKSVEFTATIAEPSGTNPENVQPSGGGRLLNLKRSPEREPVAKPGEDSVRPETKTAPEATPLKTAPTASVPGNSAIAEDSSQKAAFHLYQSGLTYVGAGNLKDGLAAFLSSVKLAPSAEVYLNIGSVYLKIDKNNEAEKAFQESVKLNPSAAEAQYGLGLASYRLKRFASARDAFKRATTLAPEMAKAHLGLGLAYVELGQMDGQNAQIRILEKLDKKLARQLSAASPQTNYSCRNFVCQ